MAFFGIITNPDSEVASFIAKTKKRMEDNNLVYNPFTCGIKQFVIPNHSKDKVEKYCYIIMMRPIYPNVTIMGWVYSIGIYILFGLTWWLLPGLILGALGVFWSADFYYQMMKLGLKKEGYHGPIQHVRPPEILHRLLFDGR